MMNNPAELSQLARSLWIGVEIGGTKLQAALGAAGCRVLRLERRSVQPEHGAGGILAVLPPLLDALLKGADAEWHDVAAVGIGFGGPVDAPRASCSSRSR